MYAQDVSMLSLQPLLNLLRYVHRPYYCKGFKKFSCHYSLAVPLLLFLSLFFNVENFSPFRIKFYIRSEVRMELYISTNGEAVVPRQFTV